MLLHTAYKCATRHEQARHRVHVSHLGTQTPIPAGASSRTPNQPTHPQRPSRWRWMQTSTRWPTPLRRSAARSPTGTYISANEAQGHKTTSSHHITLLTKTQEDRRGESGRKGRGRVREYWNGTTQRGAYRLCAASLNCSPMSYVSDPTRLLLRMFT